MSGCGTLSPRTANLGPALLVPAADAGERIPASLASLTHRDIEREPGRIRSQHGIDVRLGRASQINSRRVAYCRDGLLAAGGRTHNKRAGEQRGQNLLH